MSDHKREIEELLRQIALIDAQLLATLDKRAKASKAIGALRDASEPPPLSLQDRPRIEALVAHGAGDLPPDSLRVIFRDVFAACLGLQAPARITYLGPEGGAGLSVGRGHFGLSASFLACDSVMAALDEVRRQRADYAVLPYETSSDGPVPSTISALARSELRISLVLEASPSLHLFNRSGVAKDIEKVYATASDRALADKSLTTLELMVAVDVGSPVAACQRAAQDPTGGALASEGTGAQAGLEIAHRNVLDRGHDRVRYAVVGNRPSSRTGEDFTAIVFTLSDSPGALLEILRQFADRGINLSKIQSRPVEDEPWSYLFFLEAVGHATDRHLVSALEEVRRLTKFMRVLGSYPVGG
jgi:chorismate mutase/prephenate dehydratase